MLSVRSSVAAFLAGALAVALLSSSADARPKDATDDNWCVKPGRADRGCRQGGVVWFDGVAASSRPTTVRPGATVRVEGGGLAQLAFRRQATCEFGPIPTEVVTRFGGFSRLFLQREGEAICTIARKQRKELPYFCDEGEVVCPVIVNADGTFRSRVTRSGGATASAVGAERRVVLVLCSRAVEVTVNRESSSASGMVGTSSMNKVRIVLVEREGSVGLEIDSRPAPATCPESLVRRPKDVIQLRAPALAG